MITNDYLIIFYLETNDNKKPKGNDEEFDYYDSVEQSLVKVKDIQKYSWFDFEFIQKLPDQKKSFKLQIYNKEMSKIDMPFITMECSNHE